MPDYAKTEAVVLRTGEYSETSQIVTLWTRECGKVRGIAKGARRKTKSGGAGLDLLNLCDVLLVRKVPPALSLITGWQVRSSMNGLRSDLQSLYAGLYAAELLDRSTDEGDPDPASFDLLVRFLRALDEGRRPYPMLLRFEILLLERAGIAPQGAVCVSCGTHGPVRRPGFTASGGGLLCGACMGRYPDARPVSQAAVRALVSLSGREPPRGIKLTDREVAEIRGLLDAHLAYHLGRPLEMGRHIVIQSQTQGELSRTQETGQ